MSSNKCAIDNCALYDSNKDKMFNFTGAYLNTNSTLHRVNKDFNISDSLYKENKLAREKIDGIKQYIKESVGASMNAKVIFNSCATESMSNLCMILKKHNPSGVIIGSSFDHPAIKDNAELYGLQYEQTLDSNELNDRIGMMFITHINSATGEYLDISKYTKKLSKYQILSNGNALWNGRYQLQFKPLVVVDATQSFTKLNINMKRDKIDACFFSLHKIGFPLGMGVLIFEESKRFNYFPLIAGNQQEGMRGGSWSGKKWIKYSHLLKHKDDYNLRKNQWLHAYNYLTKKGLLVKPTPDENHIYSTLLIDTNNNCPLEIISNLSDKNIYVGNRSACANEQYEKRLKGDEINGGSKKELKVKPFDNAIRLSFTDPNELNDDILEEITSELLKIK